MSRESRDRDRRRPADWLSDPLYGCADEGCAQEVSYPSEMLQFWSGIGGMEAEAPIEAGFYCEGCLDHFAAPDEETGPSLDKALAAAEEDVDLQEALARVRDRIDREVREVLTRLGGGAYCQACIGHPFAGGHSETCRRLAALKTRLGIPDQGGRR